MKVPKLKKGYTRLWVNPDEYYDSHDTESFDDFKARTGVNWEQSDNFHKVEKDKNVSYYKGHIEITKEEYDAYWKPYLVKKALIKAIKELND
jgi:hypothetical protein